MLLIIALSCRELNLTVTYSPISLFKWQMYAAQGMRNKWYGMLGADFIEESDEDQDSLKVKTQEAKTVTHIKIKKIVYD